jgi:hypothetical protein
VNFAFFHNKMSVRPTLLKDLRRTAIEQHQTKTGTGNYNRWDVLSTRGRTFSAGKRPLDSTGPIEGTAPKTPKLDSNLIFSQLKDQDTVLSDLDKALCDLDKPTDSPPDPRIDAIVAVLKLLGKSQKNLTSALMDSAKLKDSSTPTVVPSVPAGAKKNATPTPLAPAPAPAPADLAAKKVKQVLRDAEKKTVIFNLNLGSHPAMNKDTLSRKVTESLSAAAKSGKHDYNVTDAEEVLDDILSCTKLEFLGTQSKLFFNNRNTADSRNNKMYTLPVRMDFKDRDSRFEAEVMLRKICKVNCSVPYPKKMRQLLNELVTAGKRVQPESFIRTKVNVETLTVEAHAKTSTGWLDLGLKRNIPLDILDNSTATLALAVGTDTASQQLSLQTDSQMITDESSQIS